MVRDASWHLSRDARRAHIAGDSELLSLLGFSPFFWPALPVCFLDLPLAPPVPAFSGFTFLFWALAFSDACVELSGVSVVVGAGAKPGPSAAAVTFAALAKACT